MTASVLPDMRAKKKMWEVCNFVTQFDRAAPQPTLINSRSIWFVWERSEIRVRARLSPVMSRVASPLGVTSGRREARKRSGSRNTEGVAND